MNLPDAPYYAVIFTSIKSMQTEGYDSTAERMASLCERQEGFLGMIHATSDDGNSVTTCYWENLHCISVWRENVEHQAAQKMGKAKWYDEYRVEIAKIERSYHWTRPCTASKL